MFTLRRYRVILFAVILTVITVYQLYRAGSWDTAELKSWAQSGRAHKSTPEQPQEVLIPEEPKDHDPGSPWTFLPAQLTSRVKSSSTSSETREATTTLPDLKSKPTVTGEELLFRLSDSEDEFIEDDEERLEASPSLVDKRKPRWQKPKTHFPVLAEDVIKLPSVSTRNLPTIQADIGQETDKERYDRVVRQKRVGEAFKHAWNGYKKYAMGHDEVKPLSKGSADPFLGWGATLVDSLDTLWIMGLKQEFEEALRSVEKIDFKTATRNRIPLFEVTIRYLGGLLGAYDVSDGNYPVLLRKAEELADVLMGAFDTPNRMPQTFYYWTPSYASQPHRAGTHVVMSELGSLALEFTRLAQITEKHEYYDAIARITDELEKWQMETLMPGLWPLKLDASGCKKVQHSSLIMSSDSVQEDPVLVRSSSKTNTTSADDMLKHVTEPNRRVGARDVSPHNKVWTPPLRTVGQDILDTDCSPQGLSYEPQDKPQTYAIGGQADSTYEYFPKMHLLLRGRTEQYEKMYARAAGRIRDELLFRPMTLDESDILFTARYDLDSKAKDLKKRQRVTYEVTHLSCFAGGMFGLGARIFDIPEDFEIAKRLTDGCVWAYDSMPAGVMPEVANMVPCRDLDACAWNESQWHEALDPMRWERFAAVEQWNTQQKLMHEQSHQQALETNPVVATKSLSSSGAVETKVMDAASRKRAPPTVNMAKHVPDPEDLTPTSTSVQLEVDEIVSDDTTVEFVPKRALSHERYVRARISEERLPPGYTGIPDRFYGLRPEAIESVFYMYRLTGEPIWREKGWKMFEAIQNMTQNDVANAMLKDVTSVLGEQEDKMESFWLAETLKYFYLLFSEPTLISLDEYVLNTEAHPFKIPK